jgi:hypothetical protein
MILKFQSILIDPKQRSLLVKKILLLVFLLAFGMTMHQVAFAQSERNCNMNQICAQPGDYLKYAAQVYGHNGTISYNFGNLIDPNTINVSISTLVGSQTINGQSTLNLKNTTLTNSDGSKGAFFFMVLTPINPNEIAASPFKESTDTFNGFQRSIYAIESSNGTDFQEVKVDKETGVLLDFKVAHAQIISGHEVVTGTSFVLADTNIITSSDFQGTNESSSFIPQLTNNTASAPNSVSNAPNSVFITSNSVSNASNSDSTTIIYIGIVIAVVGAGAGIMIMRKRKHKNA